MARIASPTARRMDSIYRLSSNAPSPIFGDFPDCQILGDPCTIRVTPMNDYDPRAFDILGFTSFRGGGIAIHISGKDDFGRKANPQRIHALGMQECLWVRDGRHPSGTGCSKPDPVVILESPGVEPHFALWGRADGFITLEGLYLWDDRARVPEVPFTAEHVAAYINMGRESYLRLDSQQVSTIRRLLEFCVGVTNHGIVSDDGKIGVARLVRAGGRYRYRWIRRSA